MTNTPDRTLVPVEQVDRDAAAKFATGHGYIDGYDFSGEYMVLHGRWDHKPIVQAFARHRLAALNHTPTSDQGERAREALGDQATAINLCDVSSTQPAPPASDQGEARAQKLWCIPSNLRWLAEQSDRPNYVPCGELTGKFLLDVAARFEELATQSELVKVIRQLLS